MDQTEDDGFDRLLERARTGSRQALGRLLDGYRAYLTLLARVQVGQKLGRKVGASDVVQETFLRAHEAFAQFGGVSEPEFLAWLRRILASRLVSLLRRYRAQRRDCQMETELCTDLESSVDQLSRIAADMQSTPSKSVERRELSLLLSDALEKLPDHYREVIILHQMEGRTFEEVAELMQTTAAAAQQVWIRALIKLRKTIVL